MRDTSPAAEQARLETIRGIEPVQRMVQALELSESARAFALGRLRQLHADRTDFELVELLVGTPLIPDRPGGAS